MTDINENIELPFELNISFNKLLEYYEELAESDDEFLAKKAQRILNKQSTAPILRDGFSEVKYLKEYKEEINFILQDSFNEILTRNEIKNASVPFHSLIFSSSKRFKSIIEDAGEDFNLKVINLPENDRYVMACTIILHAVYGYDLNFKRPFYYEIPDKKGHLRQYKILYNADFTEVIKKESAPNISEEDYNELLDNFDDISLWHKKFPPNSYLFKGFVINNMFDITIDHAISEIKSNLLISVKSQSDYFIKNFEKTFRSLFDIQDIGVGFVIYNKSEDTFEHVMDKGINSFLLLNEDSKDCVSALCEGSYKKLLTEKSFFTISDVDKYFEQSKGEAQYQTLHEQGIKSAIFAPISYAGDLMGVLELVSKTPKALNSVNANKLKDVMPFIVSSVLRSKAEEENLIEAVIQQECTSIHPSVYWKFRDAAYQFLKDKQRFGDKAMFREIVFNNIYPLFGQIDVQGSSDARNQATKKDLSLQLSYVSKIMKKIMDSESLPVYDQILFQLNTFSDELNSDFKVDSEQRIVTFLKKEIEPILKFKCENDDSGEFRADIEKYFDKIDEEMELIYYYRKNYDETVALINKNMALLIDQKQEEAQDMYPHYFERYKTDGVEHNMYIGEAITRADSFSKVYLYNLRLWQLQVMCEMENAYYQNRHEYPIALNVASMILVFNQPLSIRFRMDEKQFDVDGTYNARYEVVKKRVDKAFIKGTEERATQNGKITIVYSQKEDEEEYLQYVNFLQSKDILNDDVEILELENLQGVTGLKAIRVSILYQSSIDDKTKKALFTYDDLMKEISA
ncbi:cell surface protein [Sediminibacter sp. Hel_I_10]|uniref:cell surface protein n=1 Tax=Sediminibacter sp. Hel_I_10 TaxID=1392490 RepID=UPI00047CE897|nr:cell surface protein [Sediminibacter sp. Hel_I_10]